MKTTLLVVGRTVEQHYITAINDYIQRTKRYITFDMEVIPELKNTKSLSMEVQKEKEGELILKALQPGDVVVLLDEHGKEMRSLEFAEYMKRKMNTVNKRLVFIIGGPYGFLEKDKHLKITGSSTVSWKDAIVKAISEASKTIDYLSEVKIIEQRANIDGNKISEYFVDLDLSFIVDVNRKDS